jgi:hypothetical protein
LLPFFIVDWGYLGQGYNFAVVYLAQAVVAVKDLDLFFYG